MSKHTPGPWKVEYLYCSDFPENARVVICAAPKSDNHRHTKVAEAEFAFHGSEYHVDCREEAEANGRLLAAAPELLSALYLVEDYLDGCADVVDGDYGVPEPNKEMTLLREVREAIAKAGQP